MEILKNKKILMIIAGVLCGICLIVAGRLGGDENPAYPASSPLYPSEEVKVYTEQLEKRLESLLSGIGGVRSVDVMITLESSNENVYATSGANSDFVILQSSNGSESGIKLTEINAKVRGVAVVCDYGGSEEMKMQIIEMLTSLFNIGSNRISVISSS